MEQALTQMGRFPVRDVVALVGVAGFVYGVWLAWEPAAFMVGGALAVAFAVLWSIVGRGAGRGRG